jgi:hypothetical protein
MTDDFDVDDAPGSTRSTLKSLAAALDAFVDWLAPEVPGRIVM